MASFSAKRLLLIIGVMLLLIVAATFVFKKPHEEEAPTEITAAESHDAIRNTGEIITRTVLGILDENEFEITDEDLERINSAMSLLDQSKAAFYAGNYATAAGLAENSRQLMEQLKQSLNVTEVDLEDVYVEPPTGEVHKYKGIWTHTIDAMRNALMNVENLKQIGVNFVAVTLDVEMDENRNVQVVGGNDFLFYILAFHRCGLGVLLMPDPCHPSFVRWGKYEWVKGDNNVDVRRGAELLENFTPLVLEWAEIAENYGVEMYSPLNEPQTFARESAEASQWAQQIRPDLEERYSGTLVLRTHGRFPEEIDLDFRGYDYIASWGACAWPGHHELWRLDIRAQIDNLLALVERDGCENGILLDFGTAYLGGSWYEPLPPELVSDENIQSQTFQILFEEGWEKVQGFFPPTAMGWEFLGRPAENVIKSWYAENGASPPKPIDKVWKTPGLLKLIEKPLSPTKRPFYLWTSTNEVLVDEQHPGPGNFTNAMECDAYAFSHPEEAEAWLRERGIDGYGSNFFVFRYAG